MRVAPSAATIRRVIALVCPGGLAVLTGADPAGSDPVGVDGKAARGPRHGTSPAALLLAAMTGDGRTITQLRVPNKANEITCFAEVLEPFDLARVTVTADALHTQRAHARFLVEEKKAPYLLVVKGNQPELHRRLRTLPWKNVTARRYDREIGQATGKPRDKGPHRHRSRPGLPPRRPGRPRPAPPHRPQDRAVSRQSVYAITGVTSQEASPQRLGHIARPHWTIENWLRSARDTPSPRTPPKSAPATAPRTWRPGAVVLSGLASSWRARTGSRMYELVQR
ncbi:transposase [Streptomyces osmaniensis]